MSQCFCSELATIMSVNSVAVLASTLFLLIISGYAAAVDITDTSISVISSVLVTNKTCDLDSLPRISDEVFCDKYYVCSSGSAGAIKVYVGLFCPPGFAFDFGLQECRTRLLVDCKRRRQFFDGEKSITSTTKKTTTTTDGRDTISSTTPKPITERPNVMTLPFGGRVLIPFGSTLFLPRGTQIQQQQQQQQQKDRDSEGKERTSASTTTLRHQQQQRHHHSAESVIIKTTAAAAAAGVAGGGDLVETSSAGIMATADVASTLPEGVATAFEDNYNYDQVDDVSE